jgi:hypothetical protein
VAEQEPALKSIPVLEGVPNDHQLGQEDEVGGIVMLFPELENLGSEHNQEVVEGSIASAFSQMRMCFAPESHPRDDDAPPARPGQSNVQFSGLYTVRAMPTAVRRPTGAA